jgi:membrane protein DedA with SNARE-associated domain
LWHARPLPLLFGDILWYALGRNGGQHLGFLDRLCGPRKAYLTKSICFIKTYGILFLAVSEFVPGVASLACPAAGLANMSVPRFLVANTASRAVWAAAVSWLGYSGTSYTSFL